MKISTKGRYALRLMLDLAINGGVVPLKAISQRQEIGAKYLEQIVSLLSKAGFITSVRGNNGGYRLTRDPCEYTAGEILRAAEGSLSPVSCLDEKINTCSRRESCLTLPFWQGLDSVISNYVDSTTLADLINAG